MMRVEDNPALMDEETSDTEFTSLNSPTSAQARIDSSEAAGRENASKHFSEKARKFEEANAVSTKSPTKKAQAVAGREIPLKLEERQIQPLPLSSTTSSKESQDSAIEADTSPTRRQKDSASANGSATNPKQRVTIQDAPDHASEQRQRASPGSSTGGKDGNGTRQSNPELAFMEERPKKLTTRSARSLTAPLTSSELARGTSGVDENLSLGSRDHFLRALLSVRSEKFRLEGRVRERLGTRQSIRLLAADVAQPFPEECELSETVLARKKAVVLDLGKNFLTWRHRGAVAGEILTDDIVGVELPVKGPEGTFAVHCYHRRHGKGDKMLRRRKKVYTFAAQDQAGCDRWVRALRSLVRWQARVPLGATRKVMVVVNPHSGKRRAPRMFERHVRPLLELAGIEFELQRTSYSGHAVDMGKSYDPASGYEAFLFVSGDGTIFEFLNGLLTRPREEWQAIVQSTCFSIVSAGTENGLSQGIGLPSPQAALYNLIKRKQRPLDVITCTNKRGGVVHYSISGLGWGIPGDIAAQSESHRWMGTARYAYLSVKWFLANRKHQATLRYVPVEPPPPLKTYYEIRDENFVADDQYEAERNSVYAGKLHGGLAQILMDEEDRERPSTASMAEGGAAGDGGEEQGKRGKNSGDAAKDEWEVVDQALHDPASPERYPAELWREEVGRYVAIACLDTVPDGKYTNPSDGMMDLLIARKGSLWKTLKQGLLYLVGQELKSELIDYIKVRAMTLEPHMARDCLNIDGEVLEGPGPFRAEVVPRLFKVLSEK